MIFYMLFGDFPFKGMNIEYEIEKKCADKFNLSALSGLKQN